MFDFIENHPLLFGTILLISFLVIGCFVSLNIEGTL